MSARRGFTLVELLVVMVVSALLLTAVVQLLVRNQRTFTVHREHTLATQVTRAASDILFNELREVSAAGGDVLAASTDELEVRVMRAAGLVCEPADLLVSPPEATVLSRGRLFEAGDSVFIFADNDVADVNDDVWVHAVVTGVVNGRDCNGDPSLEAQTLAFALQGGIFLTHRVREGAPVRSHTSMTYGLYEYEGQYFLGRIPHGATDPVPLVGPLDPPGGTRPGLAFRYLDRAGSETAVLADIRQVEVTLRSFSTARDGRGNLAGDSTTTRIFLRN